MQKTLLTCIILIGFFLPKHPVYCQPQLIVSEVGEWKLEDDERSRWEFKSNGKLHTSYQGLDAFDSYSYEISTNKPHCPGMEIGEKPNITYLKVVDDEDGDIGCYYIFGLNDKRLTLIDAWSGDIAPFIRVE